MSTPTPDAAPEAPVTPAGQSVSCLAVQRRAADLEQALRNVGLGSDDDLCWCIEPQGRFGHHESGCLAARRLLGMEGGAS